MTDIPIRLTPIQTKVLFNIIDGASDAGACEGGLTPQEQRALASVMDKLLAHHERWKHVRLDEG